MIYSKYSSCAVSLLLFLPLVLNAQRAQENVIPLKNWAAPLYWHANQAEQEAAAKTLPQLQFSVGAVSTDALSFVAVTPCRLVDTRGIIHGFDGISPFSGPSIAAQGTATFPLQSSLEAMTNSAPAPCGVIPSFVQAYSINLAVIPLGGGGAGFVTLWPAGATKPIVATLNDAGGLVLDNAAIVAAGTPSGGISVFNSGPSTIDVVIDMNGYFAAPTDLNNNTAIGAGTLAANTSGTNNTATGASALASNTTGTDNTASGFQALQANTTGGFNVANGDSALQSNTTGGGNTASGFQALQSNTTGDDNTAHGNQALKSNTTGASNTASGASALQNNTTGSSNTASGFQSLLDNTIGGDNTASGNQAMQANTTGSNNTAFGMVALQNNTIGNNNTATGVNALVTNTTGSNNTATGVSALQDNTTGIFNTASGSGAMSSNTTGGFNTASGNNALAANTTGGFNVANGVGAIQHNTTGSENTASGDSALSNNTTGGSNTAIGSAALELNTTGSSNIAVGQSAGLSAPVANSNSIYIGNPGAADDASGTIRSEPRTRSLAFFAAGHSRDHHGRGRRRPRADRFQRTVGHR